MLTLRDYQLHAADAVEREWRAGRQSTAVVMATGLGKTGVIGEVIRRWMLDQHRARRDGIRRRALVVAHRTELIDQAARSIVEVVPDLRGSVGVVQAGRNQTTHPVLVGSVQTLAGQRRRDMIRNVGLIIDDECHHSVAASYRAVHNHWPEAQRVGFTATLVRGDDVALGDVWQSVAFRRDIGWGVRHGWLVRPHARHVEVDDLDLSRVRKSGGDFRDGDLGAALTDSMAPEAVAKAYLEHAIGADGRPRPGILFAPTVASAQAFGEALTGVGLRVGHVNGSQGRTERAGVLGDLRAGRLDAVTNCAVLTEGTDIPNVACVVIARPTLSPGLFVQMSGRGLRLHCPVHSPLRIDLNALTPCCAELKPDCLILDVVGATTRHSLVSPVVLLGEEMRVPTEKIIDDEMGDEELLSDVDIEVPPSVEARPMWTGGPLISTEVDLFRESDSMWLTTDGGVWFISAGDRYLALLPARTGRGWDVLSVHKTLQGRARWVGAGIDRQAGAMAWAEQDVRPDEMTTAARKRSWRRADPSDGQKHRAGRLGVAVTAGMTRGEVANLIETAQASQRIDPMVPGWYAGQYEERWV